MQADPSVGIEVPLRSLIWDEQGTTRIAFSDPAELVGRCRLSVLAQLRALLDQLVAEATGQSTSGGAYRTIGSTP
jgi:uncharacterized protein (DUF302 family)